MKKVFSWILAIFSCLLFIMFIASIISSFVSKGSGNVMMIPFILLLILSVISGIVSRRLAKDKSFPYYLAVPFCLFYVFFYIAMGIKYIIDEMRKNGGSKSAEQEEDIPVYLVSDDGHERKLKLFQKFCEDYEAPEMSGYGVYYDRFKDDIGRYWRSYDEGKTFIKEDILRERGWNISW